MNKKRAWIESISDTGIAIVMNFPISMLLVYLTRVFEFSVFMTSVTFTCVFTIIAIIRKYFVRVYFSKK